MSDTDIHSCSYHCDRHACVVAQRNELRDKLFGEQWVKTYSGGKPNYTQPIEKEWVGLNGEDIQNIEKWIEFKEAGGIEPMPLGKLVVYISDQLRKKNYG
jgi:hypothetical protein